MNDILTVNEGPENLKHLRNLLYTYTQDLERRIAQDEAGSGQFKVPRSLQERLTEIANKEPAELEAKFTRKMQRAAAAFEATMQNIKEKAYREQLLMEEASRRRQELFIQNKEKVANKEKSFRARYQQRGELMDQRTQESSSRLSAFNDRRREMEDQMMEKAQEKEIRLRNASERREEMLSSAAEKSMVRKRLAALANERRLLAEQEALLEQEEWEELNQLDLTTYDDLNLEEEPSSVLEGRSSVAPEEPANHGVLALRKWVMAAACPDPKQSLELARDFLPNTPYDPRLPNRSQLADLARDFKQMKVEVTTLFEHPAVLPQITQEYLVASPSTGMKQLNFTSIVDKIDQFSRMLDKAEKELVMESTVFHLLRLGAVDSILNITYALVKAFYSNDKKALPTVRHVSCHLMRIFEKLCATRDVQFEVSLSGRFVLFADMANIFLRNKQDIVSNLYFMLPLSFRFLQISFQTEVPPEYMELKQRMATYCWVSGIPQYCESRIKEMRTPVREKTHQMYLFQSMIECFESMLEDYKRDDMWDTVKQVIRSSDCFGLLHLLTSLVFPNHSLSKKGASFQGVSEEVFKLGHDAIKIMNHLGRLDLQGLQDCLSPRSSEMCHLMTLLFSYFTDRNANEVDQVFHLLDDLFELVANFCVNQPANQETFGVLSLIEMMIQLYANTPHGTLSLICLCYQNEHNMEILKCQFDLTTIEPYLTNRCSPLIDRLFPDQVEELIAYFHSYT